MRLLHQLLQLLLLTLLRIKLNHLAKLLALEGLRKRAFFVASRFHSFFGVILLYL